MNKILVTGATGHLGTAVIEQLLTKVPPTRLSVLTRSEEKRSSFQAQGFNAFLGNYDDIDSVQNAMQDVATVLLISSGDTGDRMQEHKNVVNAAREAGVKHIAYTGRCLHDRSTLANKLMVEHFETEDYIRESGLAYTLFRNVLYMDAIPQFIGGNQALEKGIFLPAGNGKVSFALRKELGEAMANVLMKEGEGNEIYHFTGPESYSFYDVAAALSELSHKQVTYANIAQADFEAAMSKKNIPPAVIQKITDFITDIKNNQEAMVYNDLEKELGRKPASLKEGLKTLFAF